jgi:hypothetical protein
MPTGKVVFGLMVSMIVVNSRVVSGWMVFLKVFGDKNDLIE